MSIIVDENEPLFDVDDYAFEPRDVKIRNGQWVDEEFEVLDFLGRGKFGEVKRCRERKTGREFAAKFILAPRPQDKEDVRQEVEVMKKLQHKRLLQLYDAFCLKNEMCLVLEIIQGGELFDRVILDDFILTERACVVFMRQICEGVEYMHNKNIIHLDLKPENILCLTRTGNRIKIIDFGLAREYDPKKELRVLFGTPEFMAPEVVQYEPIAFSTDMWSVGVICYVLLSGLSPFMGDCDGETLTNVIKASYDFDYPEFDEVSESAKDLIAKLLVIDKKKRLTATECLDHPWLRRKEEEKRQQLQLSKRRLKRFVYRRKWQKVVNAIIALKRMGVHLENLRNRRLSNAETDPVLSHETIFGWDSKRSSGGEAPRSRGHETSPDTDAADSGVGGSLKDTLGELALDSSGTAAPVSSDASGVGDDVKDDTAKDKASAASGTSGARRVAKAAGAAGSAEKRSKKGDVPVESTLKSSSKSSDRSSSKSSDRPSAKSSDRPSAKSGDRSSAKSGDRSSAKSSDRSSARSSDRSSVNSDSNRGDTHKKTGPDKKSTLDREKTPEITVTSRKDKTKKDSSSGSSGKRTPLAPSPQREISPETSKRKKHSSTETPALKKSKTPDRSKEDSTTSITEKQTAIKDNGLSRKEKTPEVTSLRYKTFEKKESKPDPPITARGIGRLQGFGKENQNKPFDNNSKLEVTKMPLEKTISTPAEVSTKLTPKAPSKQNQNDLGKKKSANASNSKGRGKSTTKDDTELNKKDSKKSSHASEIARKSSFRRAKKFDKSMRDSIHLKHKIAPTIQTRSDDKNKKDDKKFEDNPTERPKSWLFENNPFRKQDMVQNSPEKVDKFDKSKNIETNSTGRKKSWGPKTEADDTAKSNEKAKDVKFSETQIDEKRKHSADQGQSRSTKTGKKNKLSDFPSASNPNLSFVPKQNGTNSNESTLERRAQKSHRIFIEPPADKVEKIAEAAKDTEKPEHFSDKTESNAKSSPKSELKTESKEFDSKKNVIGTKPKLREVDEKPKERTSEKQTLTVDKKTNAFSTLEKQKSEPFKKSAPVPSLDKQASVPSKDNLAKPKDLPALSVAQNSRLDTKRSSVDQNEPKSPPFGVIKSNPFKLVSFNPKGSESKVTTTQPAQSPKSDAPESTGETSKPPTPTKQKAFSLFRKGSDKRKETKSPTPESKTKGLFRRGSDKNKNKSSPSQSKGFFGSGSSGESSSADKKANNKKPPSPKVDLKAANNSSEVESVSASPRDESDMKILSLMKKGKDTTPAGSTLQATPPKTTKAPMPSISPSLRRKDDAEPEQQYKSRFAAMKAMWHKNN